MNKIDVNKIKTVSIKTRVSKESIDNNADISGIARIPKKNIKYFIDSIPDVNIGKKMKLLVDRIIAAKRKKKPVIFMFGAHVIKCGLAPIVIEMMKKKFITCISTNGASLVHDYEFSYCGRTSEYVDTAIENGRFGVTEETLKFVNGIASCAAESGMGLGRTAGKMMSSLKYSNNSLFVQAYRLGATATIHVAIGTDVIIQSGHYKGEHWGKASHIDFINLCDAMRDLTEGGVVLNFGSAVILPEVFLKAVNLNRNLGFKLTGFTAANFDMIRQYRPITNIISRPVAKGGTGMNFVGYHELMLPLLYLMLNKV